MKKIIKGLKRIVFLMGSFVLTIYTKVSALSTQTYYGVPEGATIYKIPRAWKILRSFIIPIAFVIGIIIYFKKSKSSKGKKILMTLIFLAILVLIVWGINYIIINML